MAKGKKAEKKWDENATSEYMQEAFRAELVNGRMGIQDSAVAAVNDVGLHLPHLCLRYLFQRTTYPLERVMLIFGTPGCNKSTLLYWFYDLARRNRGYYLHAEVEDKDTPIMRLAMTDYDRNAGWVKACKSLDDMQSSVGTWFDWFKSKCVKGPGRTVPFFLGVDSLVAKLTEDAAKVIADNDGVPGRRWADEARSLNDWFKLIPEAMQGWPFSLIAINHDKPKKDQRTGQTVHGSPGGSAPNFYTTFRILVTKVKPLNQQASGWEGNRVKLSMDKSSLGADRQSFEAEITWRVVEGTSQSGKPTVYQQAMWNWDKATTEMLTMLSTAKKGTWRANVVDDLLGITKCTGGRYAAKAIDVPVSDPLPAAEFGRLLETRRDVLDKLEPLLGIQNSFRFQPGVDFSKQLQEATKMVDDIIPDLSAVPVPQTITCGEEVGDGEVESEQ